MLQALGTIWFRFLQKKSKKKIHACVSLKTEGKNLFFKHVPDDDRLPTHGLSTDTTHDVFWPDGPFNNNSPDAESTSPNRRFFTLRITERVCDTNIKYSANRNWIKYTGTPLGLKRK